MPGGPVKWKVILRLDGKLRLKRFQTDLPAAIEFYKKHKADGNEVHLVCANKGFPPFKPGHKRYEERPSSKHLWCPYCMKWRQFHLRALKDHDGQILDAELRCPICTITINDWYVKKYNGMLDHVDYEALKKQVGAW